MTGYNVKVYLYNLHCRDTESLHSFDRIALAGAVTTDQMPMASWCPASASTTSRQTTFTSSATPSIFDRTGRGGQAGSDRPGVGPRREAPDDNKADIIKASQEILDEVKKIPVYGTVAGICSTPSSKSSRRSSTNSWSGTRTTSCSTTNSGGIRRPQTWHMASLAARHHHPVHHTDGIGYSSWDYTLDLYAVWTANTPLLPPVVNFFARRDGDEPVPQRCRRC